MLYAKAEKCEFHTTSTTFLGYIISPGGVAMDERKVKAVLNWPEAATLKELQRFLGSTHPFTVLTDHKNLEYLRTANRLNPRQARWSLFFTRFDFSVTYQTGSKNTKADALSRQFEEDDSPIDPEPIFPFHVVVSPHSKGHYDSAATIQGAE